MSKFAKDIKINDILWAISDDKKPQLIPLIITNIDIKKMLWTGYYNLTVKLPDGSDRFISLFDTGERRDYNVPILTVLSTKLTYDPEKNYDCFISIMCSFNKDKLLNHYIDGLEKNIKSIKEVIEKGKQNLKELNNKLKYIKK